MTHSYACKSNTRKTSIPLFSSFTQRALAFQKEGVAREAEESLPKQLSVGRVRIREAVKKVTVYA